MTNPQPILDEYLNSLNYKTSNLLFPVVFSVPVKTVFTSTEPKVFSPYIQKVGPNLLNIYNIDVKGYNVKLEKSLSNKKLLDVVFYNKDIFEDSTSIVVIENQYKTYDDDHANKICPYIVGVLNKCSKLKSIEYISIAENYNNKSVNEYHNTYVAMTKLFCNSCNRKNFVLNFHRLSYSCTKENNEYWIYFKDEDSGNKIGFPYEYDKYISNEQLGLNEQNIPEMFSFNGEKLLYKLSKDNFNIFENKSFLYIDGSMYKKENIISVIEKSKYTAYQYSRTFYKNIEDVYNIIMNKHFDNLLMNPPYDKGKHMEFLRTIENVNIADTIISIQPLSDFQKSILYDESPNDKFTNIDIISVQDACRLFPDAGIDSELGIFYIDSQSTILSNDKFFNFSFDILKKCISYVKANDNLKNHLSKDKDNTLFLKINSGGSFYHGDGIIKKSTFRVSAMKYEIAVSNDPVGHVKYLNNIPTETIRKNIHSFYGSCYIRYWIYKCLCSLTTVYDLIPFLGFDRYENSWTINDYEKFFVNEIGLTKDEWNYYKQEAEKLPTDKDE